MPIIEKTSLPVDGNSKLKLETVVELPHQRIYQRIVNLDFTTGGGMANKIAIKKGDQNTSLKGRFEHYDYCIDKPSVDELLSTSGDAVIVTLDAPRKILKVRLQDFLVGCSLEFYRVDGNVLSEKPTVTVSRDIGYHTDLEFNPDRGGKTNGYDLAADTAYGAKSDGVSLRVDGGGYISASAVEAEIAQPIAILPEDPDFTDVRFAMRLKDSDDTYLSLNKNDILELHLRSYPTGPRIGIADPEDLSSVIYFWQVPGQIDKSSPAGQENVDAQDAFVNELQRHLDNYFASLEQEEADSSGDETFLMPEHIQVALVIESDSPCKLEITDFKITYCLVLQTLFTSDGQKVEKGVLRFLPDKSGPQEVFVEFPKDGILESASVEIDESFQSERLLSAGNDGGDLFNAIEMIDKGVYIDVERCVAHSISLSEAISVNGIAFGMMALSEKTQLHVELLEDWQDQPAGRKLAEGTIVFEKIGRRLLASLRFSKHLVIPSQQQPHWILIKAATGRALWLMETGSSPVRVLYRSSQADTAWTQIGILEGYQPVYRLLSCTKKAQEKGRAVMLSIGTNNVDKEGSENGITKFNLTSAFKSYLSSQAEQPLDGDTVKIPLTFNAGVPGIITVYPPYIEYSL